MTDIVAEQGLVFLGSRLKRLGERLQTGAAWALADAGLPVQPAHMPLLTALDRGAMSVGQLAEAVGSSQPGVTRGVNQLTALGLVGAAAGGDQRRRTLSLTPSGREVVARAKAVVWPRVRHAVEAVCEGLSGSLLDQVAGLEAELAASSLAARMGEGRAALLKIREYKDDLAQVFHDINAEWITAMFRLEPTDRDVLEHPRARIIDRGGAILFVEAPGVGVIGTCALQKTGAYSYELTKMGVRLQARGSKAGETLLLAAIARAMRMGADPLYLLTNRACAAAIHLYEKFGFQHDADIMHEYGARYARCDVAMRYRPPAL